MTNQSVLKKVQKALNLAHGAGTAGEARAAMLMAQKLMAKHGLNIKDIELEGSKKEAVEGSAYVSYRLKWWEKDLISIVSENFRCYGYIRIDGEGKRHIIFLGLPRDVEIAKEVYIFAKEAIGFYAREYMKKNHSKGTYIKNDYIYGFLLGLQQGFKDQVEREGWGLILVKDQIVVSRYDSMLMQKEKQKPIKSNGDQAARNQGFKDGKNLDPKKKRLEEKL